jgi:hypothetical protein
LPICDAGLKLTKLSRRTLMISNKLGRHLHNRAAQGETLMPEEQVQLEDWYKIQDAVEAELLQVAQLETARLAQENRRTEQFLEASNQTFAALQRDLAVWQKKLEAWKLGDEEQTSR